MHVDMKECVLISGGAGYIGSHTAVELTQAGYDVVIVDNFSNSDMDAVEGVRKITGVDIPFELVNTCDIEALRGVFDKYHRVRFGNKNRTNRRPPDLPPNLNPANADWTATNSAIPSCCVPCRNLRCATQMFRRCVLRTAS